MQKDYWIVAYYIFTPIEDPLEEVKRHQKFLENKDIKCRIYIAHNGINAQMSGYKTDAQVYLEWMKQDARFKEISFKIDFYHEHAFPKASIKFRKQLVALDEEVDLELTGTHLSPKEWKEMLENRDENVLLLDVRNQYEWELGHFEGAELPCLKNFRDFSPYAKKLKDHYDPDQTKVMMYCTGGIRCELYSALLKKEGFAEIYQLDGGVINYGKQESTAYWKGKLFVFDDRLSVCIDEKIDEVISQCAYCKTNSDTYYNCANMDCNELFLCCPACAKKLKGCCSNTCMSASRVRPYQTAVRPKPFRRYSKESELN
ncbi:rhodanese-related sulfurtransferase [Candidatus Rhabdochlamydia porcellionis]|jgi:UPF0176 protein|uniref:tRNA uridine(34) hydroxylase n=1 Tax=Candidatus Rhabdochlamydia porcellionis TaxID=225148 RepID=A0ABX8Z0H2_9BACT|nr:rhodanese-related sulfurtransferase [Candidatus Rhabdochlamydia porcellionis]QZA59170.1 UPF0176 protein [Candidatus Rhabdochlamydia porcellionis]